MHFKFFALRKFHRYTVVMKQVLLTINSGSSSVKFKVFECSDGLLLEGQYKHYSEEQYSFQYVKDTDDFSFEIDSAAWDDRVNHLLNFLKDFEVEIVGVVHRIVHGGEDFNEPVELTDEVIGQIDKYTQLAPLHNPVQLQIVSQIKESLPDLRQFGIFDTAFHTSIPKENFLYGLPYRYYEDYQIRRYGFHGISHKYIATQVEALAGPGSKIISCHLGSGSSVSAILGMQSIDNSFGFSPDENIITSTRVGEVDYDAMVYLKHKTNMSDDEIEELINKKSGLLGISEYTNDMKQLLEDYNTNEKAKLAIDMYVDSVCKYIFQMFYKLQGCDVLVFTAGIGEGSDVIRTMICSRLKVINIFLHEDNNRNKIDVAEVLDLTAEKSRAQILVIPTDEELQMFLEIQNTFYS